MLEAIQLSRKGESRIHMDDELEEEEEEEEELTCGEPLCSKNTRVWPSLERLRKHK